VAFTPTAGRSAVGLGARRFRSTSWAGSCGADGVELPSIFSSHHHRHHGVDRVDGPSLARSVKAWTRAGRSWMASAQSARGVWIDGGRPADDPLAACRAGRIVHPAHPVFRTVMTRMSTPGHGCPPILAGFPQKSRPGPP